jgi:hypothetical protein
MRMYSCLRDESLAGNSLIIIAMFTIIEGAR